MRSRCRLIWGIDVTRSSTIISDRCFWQTYCFGVFSRPVNGCNFWERLMKCSATRVTLLVLGMIAALVIGSTCSAEGLITSTSDLPPDGDYVSSEGATYSGGLFAFVDFVIRPLDVTAREMVGDDELVTFNAQFSGVETVHGIGPVVLTGSMQMKIEDKLSSTGTWNTEIVSMLLTDHNVTGLLLDETRPTVGSITVTDIGGGQFQIDSFFDVFTKLTNDAEVNLYSCDASTRITLVPEPGSLSLLGIGALVMCGLFWRRKRA